MRSLLRLPHLRHFSTTAPPSSISVSQARAQLRTEYDPDKALEIYSFVSKHQSSTTASRYAQELTIRRLAKSHRFSEIESLLESHKKDPKITEEPFLSNLIRSYGVAGMLDHSIKTFHQMEELKTPRSAFSFNALLMACVDSRQYDKALQLFDEIPQRYNISPDDISYGTLLKSYCEAGLPEKALEELSKIREKGVSVTTVMFSTVLNAFCKKGKIEEADNLWDEMLKSGCELDITAYNVRLMCLQNGKPERMREFMSEMSDSGFKLNSISYNYLMTCYFKNGMLEEAMKVYEEEMGGNGCNPNASTFRTMVFYLNKNEEYLKAYKVFKQSVRANKMPDFNTLKHLARGLVKQDKKKEAKELIRTVKKKFPPHMLVAWGKVQEELGGLC